MIPNAQLCNYRARITYFGTNHSEPLNLYLLVRIQNKFNKNMKEFRSIYGNNTYFLKILLYFNLWQSDMSME